jgi:hypothetical protein
MVGNAAGLLTGIFHSRFLTVLEAGIYLNFPGIGSTEDK